MGEPRPEKIAVVAEVQEKFSNAEAVILTEYRGLDVTDMAVLRAAMKQAGGEYKVYKNTLVRVAAKELNLEIEELLVGPTMLAFSLEDPTSAAKLVNDFTKVNSKFSVKGISLGDSLLELTKLSAIANMPSREQALSQLAGMLNAPMSQFVTILNQVPSKLVRTLQAVKEQKESA